MVAALLLRIYNLENRSFFDADQEWLAFRSRDLLKGDIALIGPPTSVGSFSIGPGFIYLNSIFLLILSGNPVAGAYLSVFLGILTLISLYLFSKHFVSEKYAILILVLTAFSYSFTSWDQNPWTPSLFYLAQVVILAGAYLISQKKDMGWPLLMLGAVIGFQSHIGVILSIFCASIFIIISKPKVPKAKTLLVSILILTCGLIPNIVFDLFNGFANLRRFGSIFSGGEYNYLGFSKVTGAMAYSAASILYPRQINLMDSLVIRIILAASLANGVSILFDKNLGKLAQLLLITAIFPPALFYLQQGKFSEYYIMMSVPSLVLLTGLLVYKIQTKTVLFYTILAIAIFLNLQKWTTLDRKLSLHDKKEVVREIVKMGGSDGYGVSLSTDLGQNFGYHYIFEYYRAKPNIPPLKDQQKIFTIVTPNGFKGINGFADYGGIGLLWQGL